ncbi:MAG: glycerate kinase [Gaiellaceae bacterium]
MRALACPASLKGVLSAIDASAALAGGLRDGGVDPERLPVADGGEGTAAVLAAALGGEWHAATVADPLGRPREARWVVLHDGTAVVESAEAIGLPGLAPAELEPLRASSAGLGELVLAALESSPTTLLVCLGGSATVDGGAGFREVVGDALRGRRVLVACDVRNPLLGPRGAARAFGPQKGATEAVVEQLEARLAAMAELVPFALLPGAGAAGGLGAALAALGAELVPGAALVLERVRFAERLRGAALVVTGEGAVDRTTTEGKASGEVLRRCREAGVRCAVFGGRIDEPIADAELFSLSGDAGRATDDLRELGRRLAVSLLRLA